MKSSTHRRSSESGLQGFSGLQELPENGLPDILASKRGAALAAYVNRPRGADPDDIAGCIASETGLDADTGAQEFELALAVRSRAIQKLLDPSAEKTMLALSDAWRTSPESILIDAVRVFSAIRPDGRFSDSDIVLQG